VEWRGLSSGGSRGRITGGSGSGYEEESGRGVVGRDMKRRIAVYSGVGDWGEGSLSGAVIGLSRETSSLKLVAREASPLEDELEEEPDSSMESASRGRV